MADLRDSGSLKQDADTVLFLYPVFDDVATNLVILVVAGHPYPTSPPAVAMQSLGGCIGTADVWQTYSAQRTNAPNYREVIWAIRAHAN